MLQVSAVCNGLPLRAGAVCSSRRSNNERGRYADRGRFRSLCVRHNYGTFEWGLPGGQIEAGEDPISAVEREITEETGVIAEREYLVGVYSAPYRDDLVLLFAGQARDQVDWTPTDEISDRGFVNAPP